MGGRADKDLEDCVGSVTAGACDASIEDSVLLLGRSLRLLSVKTSAKGSRYNWLLNRLCFKMWLYRFSVVSIWCGARLTRHVTS